MNTSAGGIGVVGVGEGEAAAEGKRIAAASAGAKFGRREPQYSLLQVLSAAALVSRANHVESTTIIVAFHNKSCRSSLNIHTPFVRLRIHYI